MVGINSNLAAASATRNLTGASSAVSAAVAKLSSGNRIIQASDDVAGLSIGTSISTDVKTYEIAKLNADQGKVVLQIADGALKQIGDILARQKALAVQANSGSLGDTQRGFLNQEFSSLKSEIDRIVTSTAFNGITLLNGSLGSAAGKTAATAISYTVTGEGSAELTAGITFAGSDNNLIIGDLDEATVTGISNSNNSLDIIVRIGDAVFKGTNTAINSSQAFTLTDAVSSQTLAFTTTTTSAADQTAVNTLVAAIQTDIRSSTVYQVRDFATTSAGITATVADGTILEGISGSDITLSGTGFDEDTAPVVGTFSVTYEDGNSSDGKITTTIGGVTYETTDGLFNSINTNLQSRDLDGAGSGTGVIRLFRAGDGTTYPNEYLDIDLGNVEALNLDLDTAGKADLLETALNQTFGIGNNGALSFQVGVALTDNISISISSVQTSDIYLDDDSTAQTLSIGTQAGAQTAIEVLDNAIQTVIGRRADVGAASSRFNFASANIEVSISNQDAARGSFLDADIAEESTKFATAQVKLQASVSVLAQANQIPQTLLRLVSGG